MSSSVAGLGPSLVRAGLRGAWGVPGGEALGWACGGPWGPAQFRGFGEAPLDRYEQLDYLRRGVSSWALGWALGPVYRVPVDWLVLTEPPCSAIRVPSISLGDFMAEATRDADYKGWTKEFLGG